MPHVIKRRGARRPTNRQQRGTIVRFKELVSDVMFPAESAVYSFELAPCHYPWLKSQAQSYNRFRVLSITHRWIPDAAITAAGQIVGGYTYDTLDAAPATFTQATQISAHRINHVRSRTSFGLNTRRLSKLWWNYTTEAQLASLSPSDKNVYLPATFHLGIRSVQTGQIAGSIEIEYTFEFRDAIYLGAQTEPTLLIQQPSAGRTVTTPVVSTTERMEEITLSMA